MPLSGSFFVIYYDSIFGSPQTYALNEIKQRFVYHTECTIRDTIV